MSKFSKKEKKIQHLTFNSEKNSSVKFENLNIFVTNNIIFKGPIQKLHFNKAAASGD